jgi:hypothetical protein
MSTNQSSIVARAIKTAGAAYEDLLAAGATREEALSLCARGYVDTGYPGISCSGYTASERALFAAAADWLSDRDIDLSDNRERTATDFATAVRRDNFVPHPNRSNTRENPKIRPLAHPTGGE